MSASKNRFRGRMREAQGGALSRVNWRISDYAARPLIMKLNHSGKRRGGIDEEGAGREQ